MEDVIREWINDPKFGSVEGGKYWWHHAFIFRCSSTIHPISHAQTITTPDGKMTVVPCSGDENGPNVAQAKAIAARLAAEGANKIDLCSGFTPAIAKELQAVVGDASKIAVSIRATEL